MPIPALSLVPLLVLTAHLASAQKFFPDDPMHEEPPQRPVLGAEPRALSEILEAVSNLMGSPGERHPTSGVIPAGGVNTLGEVMDGPWYVNRHARRRLSREELLRGAGGDRSPSIERAWAALVVKPHGLRPGILMRDAKDDVYLLRFDPIGRLEMATGAAMVSSRFFYALGYHVPESHVVYFERRQLVASETGDGVSSAGARRELTEEVIDLFLANVERDPRRGYRAVAILVSRDFEGLLGPYQVYGVRSDDPNDVVPHEHRRDLRGLFVFSAWLNHNFMRAVNTLDAVVEENQVPFIRHYLIDFTETLGSGGLDGKKRAWEGNERIYPGGNALFKNIASVGIVTPAWMRAKDPGIRSVGHFEYETFEPERWTTNHEIAPFANRLPDDEFWAAKQVMAFTDEDIRTLVSTGEYSQPEAAEWLVRALIERRDRIGRAYFRKVLPLDEIRVDNGTLVFEDLAVRYGFSSPREYAVRWLDLANDQELLSLIIGAGTFELPQTAREAGAGSYFAARISGPVPEMEVTVYVRKERTGFTVVGIERSWPGKAIADPEKDVDTGRSRYADLTPGQETLFEDYAQRYAERRGRAITAQEYFDSLPISERTTFDAITHALMSSELTDEEGTSLGPAFDLIRGIERIAGQYYGRSGDQQFRLYVYLVPGARETLDKAREFHFGHENTIYHVGYPQSFRQAGKEPTIQFSISEDGARADIDVDYRSSKAPQALFNGHLTSANSDVREGDNYARHASRWSGFVAWWEEIFGTLAGNNEGAGGRDLLATEAPEVPTLLPPNRPPGASLPEAHDAVQEFLTDWIVRRDYDEALGFLSPEAYACLNLDEDMRDEALDAAAARRELRTLMEYAVAQLGERKSLTEAIDAVAPPNPERVVTTHAFDSDFSLVAMTEVDARVYLCGQNPSSPAAAEYVGVLLRFKRRGAAVLGLLWRRTNERPWRLVSYRSLE